MNQELEDRLDEFIAFIEQGLKQELAFQAQRNAELSQQQQPDGQDSLEQDSPAQREPEDLQVEDHDDTALEDFLNEGQESSSQDRPRSKTIFESSELMALMHEFEKQVRLDRSMVDRFAARARRKSSKRVTFVEDFQEVKEEEDSDTEEAEAEEANVVEEEVGEVEEADELNEGDNVEDDFEEAEEKEEVVIRNQGSELGCSSLSAKIYSALVGSSLPSGPVQDSSETNHHENGEGGRAGEGEASRESAQSLNPSLHRKIEDLLEVGSAVSSKLESVEQEEPKGSDSRASTHDNIPGISEEAQCSASSSKRAPHGRDRSTSSLERLRDEAALDEALLSPANLKEPPIAASKRTLSDFDLFSQEDLDEYRLIRISSKIKFRDEEKDESVQSTTSRPEIKLTDFQECFDLVQHLSRPLAKINEFKCVDAEDTFFFVIFSDGIEVPVMVDLIDRLHDTLFPAVLSNPVKANPDNDQQIISYYVNRPGLGFLKMMRAFFYCPSSRFVTDPDIKSELAFWRISNQLAKTLYWPYYFYRQLRALFYHYPKIDKAFYPWMYPLMKVYTEAPKLTLEKLIEHATIDFDILPEFSTYRRFAYTIQGQINLNRKLHGIGRLVTVSKIEIGQFSNGRLHGIGSRLFNNGELLMGHFEHGVLHGKGRYWDSGGAQYFAIWHHGRLKRKLFRGEPGLECFK